MARRTYEGTGTLPGMDEPMREPSPSERSPRNRDRKPRSTVGPSGVSRLVTWRIVARGFVVLVGLMVAVYVFHCIERFLIVDPRFALNNDDSSDTSVEVTGASHASQGAIQAVFSEDQGRSVYLVPLSDRRSTLLAVDWVKDASVARIWPNRLLVTVDERKPVAFVALSSTRFGLIDQDGVILPPAQDRFVLPVVRGVRASDQLSQRRDRIHRMMRVTSELGDMARELSEIDVTDRDNVKVSQPYQGRVLTLLLGDHNFAGRYRNFVNHYAEIQRRLPDANTLDLRLEDRITVVEPRSE